MRGVGACHMRSGNFPVLIGIFREAGRATPSGSAGLDKKKQPAVSSGNAFAAGCWPAHQRLDPPEHTQAGGARRGRVTRSVPVRSPASTASMGNKMVPKPLSTICTQSREACCLEAFGHPPIGEVTGCKRVVPQTVPVLQKQGRAPALIHGASAVPQKPNLLGRHAGDFLSRTRVAAQSVTVTIGCGAYRSFITVLGRARSCNLNTHTTGWHLSCIPSRFGSPRLSTCELLQRVPHRRRSCCVYHGLAERGLTAQMRRRLRLTQAS